MKIERGDILICDFGVQPDSCIQDGIRPAVVISNNMANSYSPVITVVPLTCQIQKKRKLPTHVFVPVEKQTGLSRNSMVLAEQVTSIDFRSIVSKVGHVDANIMYQILKAVGVQMGLIKIRKV